MHKARDHAQGARVAARVFLHDLPALRGETLSAAARHLRFRTWISTCGSRRCFCTSRLLAPRRDDIIRIVLCIVFDHFDHRLTGQPTPPPGMGKEQKTIAEQPTEAEVVQRDWRAQQPQQDPRGWGITNN